MEVMTMERSTANYLKPILEAAIYSVKDNQIAIELINLAEGISNHDQVLIRMQNETV